MRGRIGLVLAAVLGAAVFASEPEVSDEVIDQARGAEIVFVGEIHDNPIHHQIQARFAAALQPRAIVFEMIDPDDEPVLADLRATGAPTSEISAALEWENTGWPAFEQYHQIMAAAPDARLLGALVPRSHARKAVRDGAAAAFGPNAARYGLDAPLPASEQKARETRQAAAHCDALPQELLPGMVEAQRLRDARLAQKIEAALDVPGQGPVLVITGNGHVDRRWGAPAALAQAGVDENIFLYGQFENPPDWATQFDAVGLTAPAKRGDPCAAFTGG